MTDARPTRRRRRWLVLILLLGAGAWVLATRRSAWPVDGWDRRPSAVPSSTRKGVVAQAGPAPSAVRAAEPGAAEPTAGTAGEPDVPARPARRPSPTPRGADPAIRPLAYSPAATSSTTPRPVPAESDPAPAAAGSGAGAPAGEGSTPDPTPPRPPRRSPTARKQPPAVQPFGPGSAAPLPDGSAPDPEFMIKGNAGSMLFHPPSSPYYRRTKAEVWFRTAEDATAAGFTAYAPRRKASS